MRLMVRGGRRGHGWYVLATLKFVLFIWTRESGKAINKEVTRELRLVWQ